MKITITGSTGNISNHLAQILISRGHDLTIVSSDAAKQNTIEEKGAHAAIGSIADPAFLAQAFAGADAVYAMVPPDFSKGDYQRYFEEAGKSYKEAIQTAGVKRVVFLSSIGAHLPAGTGPIAGIHQVENILTTLTDVHTTFVRAAYFYTNFLGNIEMIRQGGILGANFPASTLIVMVHPADIAAAIAEELEKTGSGQDITYISSDERTAAEVAAALGAAIGKPELPWIEFSDEEALNGMIGAGLPAAIATKYVEMNQAMGSGILAEDYRKRAIQPQGQRKLADFAEEFAAVYGR